MIKDYANLLGAIGIIATILFVGFELGAYRQQSLVFQSQLSNDMHNLKTNHLYHIEKDLNYIKERLK